MVKYSDKQINILLDAFELGLTFNEIMVFANPDIPEELMEDVSNEMRDFSEKYFRENSDSAELFSQEYEKIWEKEVIKCGKEYLIEAKKGLNDIDNKKNNEREYAEQLVGGIKNCRDIKQLLIIEDAISNNLSDEQLNVLARPQVYSSDTMDIMNTCFKNGWDIKNTVNFIESRDIDAFSDKQLKEINIGIRNGLTPKQVSFFAEQNKPEFSAAEMKEIRLGFEHGLTEEQIKLYTEYAYAPEQMKEIRKGFELGLTEEQVKIYAKPGVYTDGQMAEIRSGLESGIMAKKVNIYADPKFNKWQMEQIRIGLKHHLDDDKIEMFANADYNGMQMRAIRIALEEDFSPSEIDIVTDNIHNPKRSLLLDEFIKNGADERQIDYADDSYRQIGELESCISYEEPEL